MNIPSTVSVRAALCGLLAVVAGSVARGESASEGGGPARIGDARPALELETPEGDLITGARATAKVLIVDFFATWCGPCHSALADLVAARESAGGDVAVVLVDLGESADTVRQWRAKAHLPDGWLVALDPRGVAAHRWGAAKLPTTFIVDATGVVRHINRGWGPGYRDRLTRWLRDVNYVRSPKNSNP
jgi:thiol-disulfide isomerase/thioredoxin